MPPQNEQTDRLTPSEAEGVLRGFSAADWVRAKKLASLCASGLNGWNADDLLQETLIKLLSGERVWHRDLHPLVVIKTAMSGIASNIRKKDQEGPIDIDKPVAHLDEKDGDGEVVFARPTTTDIPLDRLDGQQSLEAIQEAVSDSDDLGLVVMAWADGLRGQDAANEVGFDMKKYDAVRKQLMRRLSPFAAERRKS